MRRAFAGVGLAAALGMTACAGHQPDIATLTSNSDQTIWEAGQKAFERHDWISARQHYRRIIDGFPQSPHAPEARIAVGDTYAKEGGSTNDLLAVGAYREFLTLYPSNPRSDYAQFQIGEAYFRRKNGPDRDQTDTREALTEYQRLLDLYPQSPFAEQARTRITETRQSLARAEFMAGYFYQRTRELCRASIARYEVILKDYPDYRQTDEVLFRLAECLQSSGRSPEALPHLNRLLEEYPNSPFAEQARQLMTAAASAPPTPSPAPRAASPAPPGPPPSPSPAP